MFNKSPYLNTNAFWQPLPCVMKIQINNDGFVAVVHEPPAPAGSLNMEHILIDNLNWFKVYWQDPEVAPKPSNNCAPAGGGDCELHEAAHGNSCLCSINIIETPVFAADETPTDEEIESQLHQGHDEVFSTANADIKVTSTGKRFKNVVSMVEVAGSGASFRNPPHFMNLREPTYRDAE
jgi:hypothetical protein